MVDEQPVPPLKVLYVAGSGRSGSTLLDVMLGQLDGFFSGGELGGLWGRALLTGELCGCGAPVGSCPLWSRVLSDVDAPDPESVVELQARLLRTRRTLRILRSGATSGHRVEGLEAYAQLLGRVYRSAARHVGARVVVDSSKRSAAAAVLRHVPGIEPYLVHLVRDPRAVVHSWGRPKSVPLTDGRRGPLPTRAPRQAVSNWITANLLAEIVAWSYRPRSIRIRYEDLVDEPVETVESIVTLLGERRAGRLDLDHGSLAIRGNHTVSGNPARFVRDVIDLKPDREWEHALPRGTRRLVSLTTAPLSARYGYSLRGP